MRVSTVIMNKSNITTPHLITKKFLPERNNVMCYKIEILNTYWGACIEEVKASEADGWELQDGDDPLVLSYRGEIFQCESVLKYRFDRGDNVTSLQQADYCIYVPRNKSLSGAYENVESVLKEKYGDPIKGGIYQKTTWITDGGQTAIELCTDDHENYVAPRVCVYMSYNGKGVSDSRKKIDYFAEALKRF